MEHPVWLEEGDINCQVRQHLLWRVLHYALKKHIDFDNKSIQPCPNARNIWSYDPLLCETGDSTGIVIKSRLRRKMDWVFDFQLQRNAFFTRVHPVSGAHTPSSLKGTCGTLLSVKWGRVSTRLLFFSFSTEGWAKQHTCNVKLRRIRVLLPWKSNKYHIFWVCVCSPIYPSCKAHAPYYIVICGLSGCTIFFHVTS